ncbi:MAG: ATP-dependent DNA helicase RecG [Candidatus Saccharibacteria bacterium]
MLFDLATPVEQLYLVGPARAKLLKRLGVSTLGDLLFYFPRSHQDLSRFSEIADLKAGETASIKAEVLTIKNFRSRIRRLNITQALVQDGSGSILCVWFNQPFLAKIIKPHSTFILSGKAGISKGKPQLQNPVYEQEKAEQIHTARLVPIYPLTANLTQKQLRSIIKNYLDKVSIPEYLPREILRKEKLMDENRAVRDFHFPDSQESLEASQRRLSFDEIFQTQIRVLQYKRIRQRRRLEPLAAGVPELEQELRKLPFELTGSQHQALAEILSDLKRPYPSNRLLEGDVGSGKTIIAAISMLLTAKNGRQSALLAPTEVLAQQHYLTLLKLYKDEGLDIGLVTSSATKINGNPVSKETFLAQVKNGKARLIVGTHSLLEKSVRFKNLFLVIVDEQHRFGVEQRSLLKQLNDTHLISMTATPIPRTLALTLYGDLDISVLRELPKGRIKIQTLLVPEHKRQDAYGFIKKQVALGRQAFVICPLVEESDKLGVKAATAEFERLQTEVFTECRLGLLHGKLKPKDKEAVMAAFKNNEVQILISTSVVEVGVDVPNASVIVIEGAERFGLAQLHQFRGRVGRSVYQSYCLLFSDDPQAETNPRLKAFTSSNNGFELAEKDLQIRGSGNLYGTEQSGYGFKVATLANLQSVERSKRYAEEILSSDPELTKLPLLKEMIAKQPAIHLE